MLSHEDKIKLFLNAVGILISFSLKALVAEKIVTSDFEGEKFNFSKAFISIQCITYMIVAKCEIFNFKLT